MDRRGTTGLFSDGDIVEIQLIATPLEVTVKQQLNRHPQVLLRRRNLRRLRCVQCRSSEQKETANETIRASAVLAFSRVLRAASSRGGSS